MLKIEKNHNLISKILILTYKNQKKSNFESKLFSAL